MPDTDDPFDVEALRATADEFAGVGLDADLPPVDRFRAGVSRLVARVIANQAGVAKNGRFALMLLHPGAPPDPIASKCKRLQLLDQGLEPLSGRIWFVTHVVSSGSWAPLEFDRPDDLFDFVVGELKLGTTPAVLYDLGVPEGDLRFYPSGMADDENFQRLRIATSEVSIDEIVHVITTVYERQLAAPGVHRSSSRVWDDAKAGVAAKAAEESIGTIITAALQGHLLTCRVSIEQPSPVGRLDIAIDEPVPNSKGLVMHHAVVELKVLRGINPNKTRVSARKAKQWVEEGVRQAAAYRNERHARIAALACFDMRPEYSGHSCFEDIHETASKWQVALCVWHLFTSSSAFRRHLADSGRLAPLRGTV